MAPEVIVVGSINTDLVIRGPRLPAPGETVLGGEFYQAAGGKGANQAVAAARAGARPGWVVLFAGVGDDEFGRRSLDGLRADGVVCDYVKVVSGSPSGVALIMVDRRGENLISVASGANLALRAEDVDAAPEGMFAGAKVLLACLEAPAEAVARALERARAAGLTTVLNPAPADAELAGRGWWSLVDVVTPNRGEAALLTGAAVDGVEDAERAGRRLLELGCRAAVVTLGAEGAVVTDELGSERVPAFPTTPVDATAAGDAFNGALAAALAEGRPLRAAARWAAAAAALSVARRGAQPSLPRRGDIERLAGGSAGDR